MILGKIYKSFKMAISFYNMLFIVIEFIRLFLLLKEHDYDKIIDYGQKITVLIGALAALTFSY